MAGLSNPLEKGERRFAAVVVVVVVVVAVVVWGAGLGLFEKESVFGWGGGLAGSGSWSAKALLVERICGVAEMMCGGCDECLRAEFRCGLTSGILSNTGVSILGGNFGLASVMGRDV